MVEVVINGRPFAVSLATSGNRNATARLRGGVIRITVPARWPRREKERVSENLLRRSVEAIESGRWRPEEARKVAFSNGQKVSVLGREYTLSFIDGQRFRSRSLPGLIEVVMDASHPRKEEKASLLARKRIVEAALPSLDSRVRAINEAHFGSAIAAVSVRDTTSRWGSCSRGGSISLSFRLLFMPERILDYVIVHELAHTRHLSHGERFWALVGKVVPDYRECRKWLRENGWRYPGNEIARDQAGEGAGGREGVSEGLPPPRAGEPGQSALDEYFEEPY